MLLNLLDENIKNPERLSVDQLSQIFKNGILKKYGKTIDEYNQMVDEYNRTVDEYNKVLTFRNYWAIYSTHQNISSGMLQSTPGRIVSGSNLYLTGEITNRDSLIMAANRIQIDGILQNLASAGEEGTKYSGHIEHSTPHSYWHWGNHTRRVWEGNENYKDPDDLASYYMPAVKYSTLVSAGNAVLALTDQEYMAYQDGSYWMEEQNTETDGKKESALVIHVKENSDVKENTASSLVSAKEVILNSTGVNVNQGTILGNTLSIKTRDFSNQGIMEGKDITVSASGTVSNEGDMTAESKLNLSARNIRETTAQVLARKEDKEDAGRTGFVVTGG